jgi:hypothetical protein
MIAFSIVGIVSPDYGTMVRREYFAAPARLYAAIAVRMVMGLVLILAARASRAPKTIRVLGALECLRAVTATLLGPEQARAVMEWESMQGDALLRVEAAVALAAGSFIAFALIGSHRKSAAKEALG